MATHINLYSKKPTSRSGFTLIELITTLAIGTILITMAVPAFSSMLEENRITALLYDFVGQLNYARSKAITRGQQVVFCKSTDSSSCTDDAEWEDGWIIFVDTSKDKQRDDDEPLLRVTQDVGRRFTIDFGAYGSDNYIAFQPSGVLKVGNGTFTFCPKSKEIAPRAVILAKTARVRMSRVKPDGTALECPD
jgi:type IV fimbrial biogenesis protein FimT